MKRPGVAPGWTESAAIGNAAIGFEGLILGSRAVCRPGRTVDITHARAPVRAGTAMGSVPPGEPLENLGSFCWNNDGSRVVRDPDDLNVS